MARQKRRDTDTHSVHHVLAEGDVLEAAEELHVQVPIDDLLKGAVRAQLSAGGATVKMRFPRPDDAQTFEDDGTDLHADNAADDLALADTDEAKATMEFHGEAYLLVSIVAGGAGCTIDQVSFAGLG